MGIRRTALAGILRVTGVVAVAAAGMALGGSGASAVPIADVSAMVAADGNPDGDTDHDWAGPWYPSREDRAAIRQLRLRQEDAWARGDGDAYASIYERDADLVNFFGEHLHGRRTIAATMQGYFDSVLSGTRLLQLNEKLRFVSPGLAVVHRTSCVLPAEARTCPRNSIFVNSNIAVKSDGEWLITSFQNTLIQPMPEAGPGDPHDDDHGGPEHEGFEPYTNS